MQTLQQLLKSAPALAASTENLAYQKRVRRAAIEAIKKLENTTSPRDLARKVIAEMTNTEAKMKALFSSRDLANYSKAALLWNKLDASISLSINTYLGLLQKSNLECEMVWDRAKKTVLKHEEGNLDVHLGGQKDSFRVYITNPDTLVAQCENVDVSQYLDKDVKDRGSFTSPRQCTFIQLSDTKSLMLFSDPRNAQQRRFIVSNDKVKHFTFEPIGTYYCQDGTHIARKEFSGNEFAVNKYGESIAPKDGLIPSVFVVDASFRGRMGDVGIKGPQGENGREFSIRNRTPHEHQMWAKSQGKRIPTSQKELHAAFDGDKSYYVPFSKAFFDEIKRLEKESDYE
jgi:hypothetical protein